MLACHISSDVAYKSLCVSIMVRAAALRRTLSLLWLSHCQTT